MASVYINLPALSVGSVTVTGVAQETTLQSILTEVQELSNAKTASYDEKLTLTTVDTFTAPANAVSANIMNIGSGTDPNVWYKQGGTATTTSGLRLEPGRSERIENGADVSIVAESGTAKVAIIWDIKV